MARKRTVSSVKHCSDRLWSQIVRARAGGRCERCASTDYIQAHHIIGRSNHVLRYCIENGVALCARCHRWCHDDPIAMTHWLEGDRTGDVAFIRLKKQREGLIKRSFTDYLALEADLKAALAELEAV